MPPAPGDHHALGEDLAVADQVLADDIDIVELALARRQTVASPTLPGLRVPSSGRLSARRRSRSRAHHLGQRMPRHRNFDIVVSRSKAGPSMQSCGRPTRSCRAGSRSPASPRAVLKPNEPLPWPMSKITPRLRASSTACLTLPCAVARRVGEGAEAVGQHVARPQQARSPPRSDGGGMVDGPSAACRPRRRPPARCPAAPRPGSPRGRLPTRTLMPTITSRFASATATASRRPSGACPRSRRPSRSWRRRRCRGTRC